MCCKDAGGGIERRFAKLLDGYRMDVAARTDWACRKAAPRQIDHGLIGVDTHERPGWILRAEAENFLAPAGADHQDLGGAAGKELEKRGLDNSEDRTSAGNVPLGKHSVCQVG